MRRKRENNVTGRIKKQHGRDVQQKEKSTTKREKAEKRMRMKLRSLKILLKML